MLNLFVDGDACPVKSEVVRVATRYALPVKMVSNQGLRAALGPNVENILVGTEFDAADDWIVEHAERDDIVITADILLAGRCLEKGCRVLGPAGNSFTPQNIGSALAMRELNAHLRETGEVHGHHREFSKKDRSDFLQSLDLLIQKIMRESKK